MNDGDLLLSDDTALEQRKYLEKEWERGGRVCATFAIAMADAFLHRGCDVGGAVEQL